MKDPIRNYGDAYLICRDVGHAWIEDETLAKKPGEVGSYARVLGCGRCNMSRIETLTYYGELLFRTYRQPTGYKLTRVPVSVIRAERVRRVKAEARRGRR